MNAKQAGFYLRQTTRFNSSPLLKYSALYIEYSDIITNLHFFS